MSVSPSHLVNSLTSESLVKYTRDGSVTVRCSTFGEPEGLRDRQHTAVEIVVADTGCGIQSDKLEYIFREFEQVESSEQKPSGETGVGKNSISVVAEHGLTSTALYQAWVLPSLRGSWNS
jgi:signal transduction histidine kinase